MDIRITHIDTACCLIEWGKFRILTDPVLDPAGQYYHHGFGAISKKTSNPAVKSEFLIDIDLILLSHPQHKDNFDKEGRKFARTVPLILSTTRIEKSYRNGKGLKPWQTYKLSIGNEILTITATPAQHHPSWLPKFFSGEVVGFVLQHSGSKEVLYITGDTVFFKGINEVARRFPTISYALIHVGSAEFRYLSGLGKYTMARKGFIQTVQIINPKLAIPIHNSGWSHFKENDAGVLQAVAKAELTEQVAFLQKGKAIKLASL